MAEMVATIASPLAKGARLAKPWAQRYNTRNGYTLVSALALEGDDIIDAVSSRIPSVEAV